MTTRFAVLRDIVLLFVGTAGVLHQEFVRTTSDPALLMFYAAIFGLTAFLPNGVADAIRAQKPLPAGAVASGQLAPQGQAARREDDWVLADDPADDPEPEPEPRPRRRSTRKRPNA